MLTYRPAVPSDAQMIIDLHVSMSQSVYAHILPQAYLKEVLPAEKQELWKTRCAELPSPDHLIIVACEGTQIAGFCCFVFNEETEFGTYLHNLYVSPSLQGKGVARALLREALITFDDARKVLPVHLVAFAKNTQGNGRLRPAWRPGDRTKRGRAFGQSGGGTGALSMANGAGSDGKSRRLMGVAGPLPTYSGARLPLTRNHAERAPR